MMAQSQKLFPLVGISLLGLLIGLYLFAAKRFSKSKVTKHSVGTSSKDTLKYWTADKMRSAQPAPLPTTDKVEPTKKPSQKTDPQHS